MIKACLLNWPLAASCNGRVHNSLEAKIETQPSEIRAETQQVIVLRRNKLFFSFSDLELEDSERVFALMCAFVHVITKRLKKEKLRGLCVRVCRCVCENV